MLRCVRLWSGLNGASQFEDGAIDLEPGPRGDGLSDKFPVAAASFQETRADPKLGWHTDPARQLVITLSGTLEFTTHDGLFSLHPGDVLFTEDTSGRGHDWRLVGDQPWRRLYAVLDKEAVVPFRPAEPRAANADREPLPPNPTAATEARR
jgi:hypothetical protein